MVSSIPSDSEQPAIAIQSNSSILKINQIIRKCKFQYIKYRKHAKINMKAKYFIREITNIKNTLFETFYLIFVLRKLITILFVSQKPMLVKYFDIYVS